MGLRLYPGIEELLLLPPCPALLARIVRLCVACEWCDEHRHGEESARTVNRAR